MKIKTSWNRIIRASNMGRKYLSELPDKTKLRHAIERSLPRFAKTNDALQDEMGRIDVDYASVDAHGELLVDITAVGEGTVETYRYTPAKKKERSAARLKALAAESVEIEPYFATAIPDDISEEYLDAFEGLIIKTEDVERIRAARESESETSGQPECSGPQEVIQ